MTSDKLTLKDLLREFNRGNFYHVNDIDENKSYSNLTCEKTYQYLEAYEKLQKQNEKLKNVLKFYAVDEMEWQFTCSCFVDFETPLDNDKGAKARQILKEIEREE